MKRLFAAVMFGVLLAAAACSGSGETTSPSGEDAPAQAVVNYLQAKVAGNRDGVRDLLCSALESQLDREALSFSGVNAALENAACSTGADGTTVTCTGQIAAVYGLESRTFPLSRYNVVQEDGQWRWCGEAAP
ncbi:MAG: hypothetical protein SF162_01835 [bacterium]|nr:hypothetical protein [bacterium]